LLGNFRHFWSLGFAQNFEERVIVFKTTEFCFNDITYSIFCINDIAYNITTYDGSCDFASNVSTHVVALDTKTKNLILSCTVNLLVNIGSLSFFG